MDINKLSVELLSAEQSEADVLDHLVSLVNQVYKVSEANFWKDDYLRTDVQRLRKAVGKSGILTASYEG
ncbi:MAG: hypothetical protein JKY52_19100 [Flavobacteriales bacterium]|nr:hypothetical protein [Flavobacteriales bacterium]